MLTKAKRKSAPNDPYLDLVLTVHPLRPIRNTKEHAAAAQALRSLGSDRRRVAADYSEVLISLIERYEREKHLIVDTSKVSAADVVRHLLEEHGLSVNAFAKKIGVSQSGLSDMLNGKRDWSKSAIVSVADFFGLSRGFFLE